MNLVLMRHGQTEWNQGERFTSSTDVPLSAEGRATVRAVAAHMKDLAIKRIVSSPSARAIDTATVVNESLGLGAEIQVVQELREVGFGDFEGRSKAELRADPRTSTVLDDWFSPYGTGTTPPNAEPWQDATVRAQAAIELLSDGPNTTLVVSHGYFLRLLIVQALKLTPPQAMRRLRLDNASISALSNADGYWKLLFANVGASRQTT